MQSRISAALGAMTMLVGLGVLTPAVAGAAPQPQPRPRPRAQPLPSLSLPTPALLCGTFSLGNPGPGPDSARVLVVPQGMVLRFEFRANRGFHGGKKVRYKGVKLPSGAALDRKRGVVQWRVRGTFARGKKISKVVRLRVRVRSGKKRRLVEVTLRSYKAKLKAEEGPTVKRACVIGPQVTRLLVLDLNGDGRLDVAYEERDTVTPNRKQVIHVAKPSGDYKTLLDEDDNKTVHTGLDRLRAHRGAWGGWLLAYHHGQSRGQISLVRIQGQKLVKLGTIIGLSVSRGKLCLLRDGRGRIQGGEASTGRKVALYRYRKGAINPWRFVRRGRPRCGSGDYGKAPRRWPGARLDWNP